MDPPGSRGTGARRLQSVLDSEEVKRAEETVIAFGLVWGFGALLCAGVIQRSAICVDAVPASRSVQQSFLTNRAANFLEV